MNENIKPIGKYRAIIAEPEKALGLYGSILDMLKVKPRDEWDMRQFHAELQSLLRAYHRAAAVGEACYANLVPTVGRSVLAQRLAGTTTYSGTVSHVAIGSNNTTPTNGDTQLGTEVYRQAVSSATYANEIAYLSCFIAQGTATGTHLEGGLFIDGSGSANTGQMFSHVIFSPSIVKGALNSLTLDVSLTMS